MYFKYLLLVCSLFVYGCASGHKIPSDVRGGPQSATIRGTIQTPAGDGPHPTVVLMHGCGGLGGAVIDSLRRHASFLKKHGYASVILDSFGPRGKISHQCSNDNTGSARYYRTFDAFNTLTYLRQQDFVDPQNIFLMGQSNGGSVAILVSGGGEHFKFAKDHKYNAAIAYYPWCGMAIDNLVTPLLVLGGEKDNWTPISGCELQKDRVKGEVMEVVAYPDVGHGFDLPLADFSFAGHDMKGDWPSTKDSQLRMLAFFEKHRL